MSTYIRVFNAALGIGAAAQAGTPFTIVGERVTLDWTIVVAANTARVQWWAEFTGLDNPATAGTGFFREAVEEVLAGGAVNLPQALREFQANGGGALAVGTHRFSIPLVRAHQICRVQVQIPAASLAGATISCDALGGALIR